MKRQTKLIGAVIGLVSLVVAAVAMAPLASADGQGGIGGGANLYEIANLTTNSGYANPQSAKACDQLEYSVELNNYGYTPVSNINVSATLPSTSSTTNTSDLTITYNDGVASKTTGSATLDLSSAQTVSYVSNSTELIAGSNVTKLSDGIIGSGVNVGSLNGSTTEFVNFKVNVGCPTVTPPSYACTELGITAEDNNTVKISNFATTQANGATFTNAVINWGDNSTPLTSANPIGQTHQYAANGTYTVTATANFNVNGQNQSATSIACAQQVTFSSTTPPTVTPPTTPPAPTPTPAAPAALVNTGPGSVIGIFAAASIAGTVAYRRLLARRLSRQ